MPVLKSKASVSAWAETTLPMKRVWSPMVYQSCRVHSIQPTQPSSRGASTSRARKEGMREASSLSPAELLTMPSHWVWLSSTREGMLTTNSSPYLIMSWLRREGWTAIASSGGLMLTGIAQAIGAALETARHWVLTISTGAPPSSRRASSSTSDRRTIRFGSLALVWVMVPMR